MQGKGGLATTRKMSSPSFARRTISYFDSLSLPVPSLLGQRQAHACTLPVYSVDSNSMFNRFCPLQQKLGSARRLTEFMAAEVASFPGRPGLFDWDITWCTCED